MAGSLDARQLPSREAAWVERRVDVEVEAAWIVDDLLGERRRHVNSSHSEFPGGAVGYERCRHSEACAHDDGAVDPCRPWMDVRTDDTGVPRKGAHLKIEVGGRG